MVPQGQRPYEAGNVRDCGGKMPLITGRRKGRKNRCVIKLPMSKAFPEDRAFFSLPLLRTKSLTLLEPMTHDAKSLWTRNAWTCGAWPREAK